jgi:type IV pilus assembly protein PilV
VGGGGALTDCSTKTTQADIDLCDWGNELVGAAEVAQGGACTTSSGANCIGAMLGARGCIAYDASTELTDSSGTAISGTGVQTITIAWQGVAPTVTPPAAITCGQGSYPSEAQRRVVTATIRVASLTAK